jgi:hypothetical protein
MEEEADHRIVVPRGATAEAMVDMRRRDPETQQGLPLLQVARL